jgi:hypothetical protein
MGVYKLIVPVDYLSTDRSKEMEETLTVLKSQTESAIQKGGAVVLPNLLNEDGNQYFDLIYVGGEVEATVVIERENQYV